MRQLAAACELNVATLYHYFPSKEALIKAVIAERRYGERLSTGAPPIDAALPPPERLALLVEWLWTNTLAEESVLRLLLGESLRGEAAARASTSSLLEALDQAIAGWLVEGFPELTADPATVATLIRSQVIAFVVEHLALDALPVTAARARSRQVAAVVFP